MIYNHRVLDFDLGCVIIYHDSNFSLFSLIRSFHVPDFQFSNMYMIISYWLGLVCMITSALCMWLNLDKAVCSDKPLGFK